MPQSAKPNRQVASLARGLRILDFLSESECNLTGVAAHLGISQASTLSLLRTLQAHGYVARDEFSKRYRIDYKVIWLVGRLSTSDALTAASRPILQRLNNRFNEEVYLEVLRDGQLRHLFWFPSRQQLVLNPKTHFEPQPHIHATAAGKVLLAGLKTEVAALRLGKGPLPRLTKSTIVDPAELLAQLEEVRTQGYALNRSESMEDWLGVASPVRNMRGEVVAAVSIGLPATRSTPALEAEIKEAAVEAAGEVSRSL